MTATTAMPTLKISKRNFWSFALGSFGRDFFYTFFNSFLLTYILFTKKLSPSQFACVSIIIIAARVFDAFNDPLMGGIIEITRSKWGKFRPWIFSGALSTSVVIALLFVIPSDGWVFIALLAVMYFLYSITFTMNDIAFWGMLPALARDADDRNRLMSITSFVGGCGSGLVGFAVPALTTTYSRFLGGSASKAYMWCSIVAGALMIGFQCITVFGSTDKSQPSAAAEGQKPRFSLKDMFRVIKNNDQLLVAAVCLTIYSVGTGVVGGGLSLTYIYFEFGYNGMLTTLFGVVSGFFGTVITLTFPYFVRKTGRDKVITFGAITTVVGYALMLIMGLTLKVGEPLAVILEIPIYTKFIVLALVNCIVGAGQTCFYLLMFINLSNTVEYNEWKTGRREEGLIFSLRPFSAKLSSAIVQLLVTLIYLAIGITSITNGISDLDQQVTRKLITNEEMLKQVNALLAEVPNSKSVALLCCMCIIPIIFLIADIILYKKKFILNESTLAQMAEECHARELSSATNSDEATVVETQELLAEVASDTND